jgi:hypothetical protein
LVTAVALLENISNYEAARLILNESTNFQIKKDWQEVAKKEKEKAKYKSEIVKIILKHCSTSNIPCWKYLTEKRAISLEVIKKAIQRGLITFLPNNLNFTKEIPFKLIEKAGLIKEKVDKETGEIRRINILPFLLKERPIVFPFNLFPEENHNGAEFRTILSDKTPKAITLGVKGFWYWETQSQHLLVCEGFIDLLSALTMGWKGEIIAVAGVWDVKRIPASIWQNKTIWFALDADQAGVKVTNWAIGEGIVNYVFSLPEEKDLNNILKEGKNFKSLKIITVKTTKKYKKEEVSHEYKQSYH